MHDRGHPEKVPEVRHARALSRLAGVELVGELEGSREAGAERRGRCIAHGARCYSAAGCGGSTSDSRTPVAISA